MRRTLQIDSRRTLPILCVTEREAARSLSLSLTSFRRHVKPHVRCARLGRVHVVVWEDLRDWLDEHARRQEHTR